MIARLNWTLLALFLLSMIANFTVRPDPTVPNIEILPDMAHSVAYASFSPNPILPDGKTMQPPVPGTLPRGFAPLHYQATPEDALRAAAELRIRSIRRRRRNAARSSIRTSVRPATEARCGVMEPWRCTDFPRRRISWARRA